MSTIERMEIIDLIGSITVPNGDLEDLIQAIYDYGQNLLEAQALKHLHMSGKEIVAAWARETARKTYGI